jgi:hypothetical protein
VELYRRGLALRDFRTECIRSDEMCDHDECTELKEISSELARLLKLFPHQPSPLSSYDEIQTWPENGGPVAEIKRVLQAALAAEIEQEPKP